ncbi:MAG: ribosomal RNA small subunit methyltransferase A [Candidatus Krumholzibacteria bacterium]|nr:ribosomal RNA small subunit methyltransferase A [Candidatus Krumholzibacteria bacterium]
MDRSRPAAKKSLGQNFLVSEDVARRIVEAVLPAPGELVFEIGPGRGALTVPLAESRAEIVAYEIDRSLVRLLGKRCAGMDNVEVVHADIRDMDLDAAASERKMKRYKIVGNIPYHLTSTILLDLPRWKGNERSVLMVQREVGERVHAAPGERRCGVLSVFLQSYFDIARVTRVRAGSFSPRPGVESVVLRFTCKEPGRGPSDMAGFLAFLKLAFSQRRKKLRSVISLADQSGIDLGRRPEELDLESWLKLFARFNEIRGQR